MLRVIKVAVTFFLSLVVLLFLVKFVVAQKAYVVKVIDGDSLLVELDKGRRVQFRLYGVDAPEHGQRFSKKSTAYLRRTLLKKKVEYTKVTKDKYGRYIVIIKGKGKTVNEALVQQGFAWVYPRYCKKKVCKKWKNVERKAQRKKYGLWQDTDPVSPWQWRHK